MSEDWVNEAPFATLIKDLRAGLHPLEATSDAVWPSPESRLLSEGAFLRS